MQMELPLNDLTAILAAGEGPSPLPAADPFAERVLREGIFDGDDDLPGIHISGSDGRIRTIADPSIDQPRERARMRARMGPPPQNPIPVAAQYPGAVGPGAFYQPAPMPMSLGAQVMVQAVDLQRGVLLTSHGAIPLSPETVTKIMQLSVAAMREFFADSINATMQAYNLGGKRRAKPKRRKPKKV